MSSKTGNKLWLYGKHAVIAALQNQRRRHFNLLITKPAVDELKSTLATIKTITPQIVGAHAIEQVLPKGSLHQGVALETSSVIINGIENLLSSPDLLSSPRRRGSSTTNKLFSESSLDSGLRGNDCVVRGNDGATPKNDHICLVALDQITDQHNIGSIMRSAAAFDIDGIITLADNTPCETSHIAKAASGALELVPLVKVVNLVQTIKYLQERGFWVIGLDGHSDQYLDQIKLPKKTLFIVGSEGDGLRRLTKEKCDYIAKIRMSARMESLNVSVATALAMQAYFSTIKN